MRELRCAVEFDALLKFLDEPRSRRRSRKAMRCFHGSRRSRAGDHVVVGSIAIVDLRLIDSLRVTTR